MKRGVMKKLIAGLTSLIGLAACGQDAPYSSNVNYSGRDSTKDYFFTATSRGPLLVEVFGDYPGYDNQTLGPLIRSAMERGVPSRPFKATGNISEAESPAYRVIWLIAPPKNYNHNRVCKGQVPVSEPADKPTFGIVFCSDDTVLRAMGGWMNTGISADSELFTKFVGVVTRDLFK